MSKVAVARSCDVQALFALLRITSGDILKKMKSVPEFVDHRLTRTEFSGDAPGFIQANGTTLIRWCVGDIAVVLVKQEDEKVVHVDLIEKLDGWMADDPRYLKHLKKMHEILGGIAKKLGLKQVDLSPSDPSVTLRLRGLDNGYGFGKHLSGDTRYLAVVAMQGIGADPFIRVSAG